MSPVYTGKQRKVDRLSGETDGFDASEFRQYLHASDPKFPLKYPYIIPLLNQEHCHDEYR